LKVKTSKNKLKQEATRFRNTNYRWLP